MSVPTAEQLAKLPLWAKKYIEQLEMRTREAKKELHEYLDKAPSEFAVQRAHAYGTTNEGPEFAYLPKNETLICFLDDNHEAGRIDRNALMLHREQRLDGSYYLSVSSWGQYPAVQPQAANVLRIHLVEKP